MGTLILTWENYYRIFNFLSIKQVSITYSSHCFTLVIPLPRFFPHLFLFCYFFLSVCVCVYVLSPSDGSHSETPGTDTHRAPLSTGFLQTRKLESVSRSSSKGCFQPRDWTQVSCIADIFFTVWATREAFVWLQDIKFLLFVKPWGVPMKTTLNDCIFSVKQMKTKLQ